MTSDLQVAAYTFQADLYCSGCMVNLLVGTGEASPAARDMSTEDVLDQLQHGFGIDRGDEGSYDSGEFPKVVFKWDLALDDRCGGCGERLH